MSPLSSLLAGLTYEGMWHNGEYRGYEPCGAQTSKNQLDVNNVSILLSLHYEAGPEFYLFLNVKNAVCQRNVLQQLQLSV